MGGGGPTGAFAEMQLLWSAGKVLFSVFVVLSQALAPLLSVTANSLAE